MTKKELIEYNKLIAIFMGYKYPYKKDIWRSGYALKDVDFLSKIQLPALEEIKDDDTPTISNNYVRVGKYGLQKLYDNIIWFETSSTEVPIALDGFNNVMAQYHSNWNKLMNVWRKVIDEIGLYMNNHNNITVAELWLEKSKEIETDIITVNIGDAFIKIANLIRQYNFNKSLEKDTLIIKQLEEKRIKDKELQTQKEKELFLELKQKFEPEN